MSLTYQPFANAPQVESLSRDLAMNVSDKERLVSTAGGLGLLLESNTHHGIIRAVFVILGAMLLRRAWTGRCPAYQWLQIDTRHHT